VPEEYGIIYNPFIDNSKNYLMKSIPLQFDDPVKSRKTDDKVKASNSRRANPEE
jgi:hypothetical protein